ncbi:hypothetical protein FH972_021279 [Carpinus fangiana]|uniref:Major facilitator superfamily (MFS) profile domain-containing protein n=1 Tax=Carpinus fangiana TaxID=176857 RepID=A0A5N6KPG9_9ROSI|nr:hypothetical protein FH972_021279 [Carpinus fangiana]
MSDKKPQQQHPFNQDSRYDDAHLEKIDTTETRATYYEPEAVAALPDEHRKYLLMRHGTLDLEPLPSWGDADPYNWPQWKKVVNLVLVAFQACMGTFTAAAIIPAYENIAEDLGVSLQRASYLTSLQICILGVAPLIWRPLSNRYGRRPVFLVSLLISLVGNVGCANCYSYASMAACRAIVAFFISPAGAIGSAVVKETFFKKQRARFMGVWTLMVTLGVPLSPFIFGFVTLRVGYRWIYYILAITNGVHLILYSFLGPETRYIRRGVHHQGSSLKQQFLTFHRIDPNPLRWTEFFQPLRFFAHVSVVIPASAYAMVFLFSSVLITVEIPQLFAEKFGFNSQQLGLQYLGIIIGSVLGEQIGGYMSDIWMNRRKPKNGLGVPPEFRLWLSYTGYLLAIVGLVVFLVRTDQVPANEWNVTPIVGAAIAAGGNQIVTTVLVTYAVDCHTEDAASVGVFITFVRQIWGFIGPFWYVLSIFNLRLSTDLLTRHRFPQMFEQVGLRISAAIASALIIGVSILPTILLQFRPPGRVRR